MMNKVSYVLLHRRGTTGEWLASSIILEDGELGIEVLANGTNSIKIGDGKSRWVDLPYGIATITEEALAYLTARLKETFTSKEESLTNGALAKEIKAQIAGWIGDKPENFEIFQSLKTLLKKNGNLLEEVGPLNFYTKDEVDEFIRGVRTFSKEDIVKLLKKKVDLEHVKELQTRVETLELGSEPPPQTYTKEELDLRFSQIETNGKDKLDSIQKSLDVILETNSDLSFRLAELEKRVEKALSKLTSKVDAELVYSRKDVDAKMRDFVSKNDLVDLTASVDRLEFLADIDLTKIVSSENVYTKTEVQQMIQKALTSK